MATTWGTYSWGDNSWASDQNNIDVSGISATFNIGQAQYVPINGWSRSAWGFESWGVEYQNQNVDVTGFGLSTNQGEETINAEVNEGWGRLTWGENAWGIAGQVLAGGQELSSNIGSITVNAEVNIGWGSDTWGYETWGISGLTVDLTGIGLTATIDDVTIKADATTGTLTGEEMTSVVGDALGSATVDAPLTGQPMTATLQYQEAIVDPTGQELTANDGTADLDANTIAEVSATSASTWGYKSAWGFGVYGNQQVTTLAMAVQENDVDPAPDAEATGQAMAMVQGEETVTGDANVDVTGQAMTMADGTAELDANTQVDVTGQEMAMQEGDETVIGNANVILTGNALTMATGSLRTLIWNQVNTGTAPVVPPGWQEVDTAA